MFKLLKYLRPYKGRAIFMIFLLFAQVLGTLYIPTLTAAIVNKGIVTGNVNEVWRIGGMMMVQHGISSKMVRNIQGKEKITQDTIIL